MVSFYAACIKKSNMAQQQVVAQGQGTVSACSFFAIQVINHITTAHPPNININAAILQGWVTDATDIARSYEASLPPARVGEGPALDSKQIQEYLVADHLQIGPGDHQPYHGPAFRNIPFMPTMDEFIAGLCDLKGFCVVITNGMTSLVYRQDVGRPYFVFDSHNPYSFVRQHLLLTSVRNELATRMNFNTSEAIDTLWVKFNPRPQLQLA
jgi:hypothetical protein